jgi:hypothetical protein|tara:strand:- start:20972 stop:21103 length:132 start_codon:yes stop_codon:yes gene_type:complete
MVAISFWLLWRSSSVCGVLNMAVLIGQVDQHHTRFLVTKLEQA